MKKFIAVLLSALMLCACVLPAGAITYSPNAPEPKEPEAYRQAMENYQATEAVRLGLASDGLESDWGSKVTRLEVVETALTTAAAHYGSDLENFLADCAQSRPEGAAQTDYQAGAFSDTNSFSADWAMALGLTRGTGNGTFSPNTAVTESTAAAIWAKAAALCGLPSESGGESADGTYTRQDCLMDAMSLYSRANQATVPLLTYEAETARLKATFQKTDYEKAASAGTILYGTRDGAAALCIAYAEGGARTIPLPDGGLSYISDIQRYESLLSAYGSDGQEYRIDLYTGACTPVASDTRTDSLEGSGDKRAENEYGRYSQEDVAMQNNSAAPHTLRHLTMETYTNGDKAWSLLNGDRVVFHISAEQSAAYPFGQNVNLGYIQDGKITDAVRGSILGDTTLSFSVPASGEYQFFLENRSGSVLYLTAETVEIYHNEDWETSNLNDLNGTAPADQQ